MRRRAQARAAGYCEREVKDAIMLRFTSLALVVAIFSLTDSLPNGAPETACDSLTPNHASNTPQISDVPYVIDFGVFDFENGSYVYNPGRTYTCKIPIVLAM